MWRGNEVSISKRNELNDLIISIAIISVAGEGESVSLANEVDDMNIWYIFARTTINWLENKSGAKYLDIIIE